MIMRQAYNEYAPSHFDISDAIHEIDRSLRASDPTIRIPYESRVISRRTLETIYSKLTGKLAP